MYEEERLNKEAAPLSKNLRIVVYHLASMPGAVLALAEEEGETMREHLQARLDMLRNELEKGQVELQKVENQRTYLRETVLRISGAIQVLEELLVEGQPEKVNGVASVDKAPFTTTHTNGIDV